MCQQVPQRMRRAVVVQPSTSARTTVSFLSAMASLTCTSSVSQTDSSASTTTTKRRRRKGKHSSTTDTSSTVIPTSVLAFSPSTAKQLQVTGSTIVYDSGLPANARATAGISSTLPSGNSSISSQEATPLPKAALYGIIAGGTVCLALLLLCTCLYVRKKKRDVRQTADWYGVSEKNEQTYSGPGNGPGAKALQLSDSDSWHGHAHNGHEPMTGMKASASSHAIARLAKMGAHKRTNTQHERFMDISKPYDVDLAIGQRGQTPPRPPRPVEDLDLSTSPQRVLASDRRMSVSRQSLRRGSRDLETYERNIMALTSSMSFDTPRPDDIPSLYQEDMPPAAFAGPGQSDGFEGIGRDERRILPEDSDAEETIRPLHIRNPSSARSQKHFPYTSADAHQLPKEPPTLAHVDLGITASETASMRELENVLGSFGRGQTPTERENPFDEKTLARRSYIVPAVMKIEAPPSPTSLIPQYRLNKPAGLECNVPELRNVLSVYSSAGEVVDDLSPTASQFADHATPNDLGHMDSEETLVDYDRKSQSRRVSFAVDTRSVDNPKAEIQSVAELVRSKSLKSLRSAQPPLMGTLRGAFDDMDFTTFQRPHEKQGKPLSPALSGRSRSSSFHGLSPVLKPTWWTDRQRTSTAIGMQCPPVPLLATPEIDARRLTTDSEARFALGTHMLSALDSPGLTLQATPHLPYLRSPDLRVQPPSPSQTSDNTTFSTIDREREYHEKLAQDGFTPLSQMASSAKGHSQYYRSPIDSIVGVFEFDDPEHSAVINSIPVH